MILILGIQIGFRGSVNPLKMSDFILMGKGHYSGRENLQLTSDS